MGCKRVSDSTNYIVYHRKKHFNIYDKQLSNVGIIICISDALPRSNVLNILTCQKKKKKINFYSNAVIPNIYEYNFLIYI